MMDAITTWLHGIDWAFWGTWTLSVSLLTAGLLGAVVPYVPGPLVIFLASVLHAWLRPESGIGWWSVGLIGLMMLVTYALDFLSAAAGTKRYGGTKWGVVGVLIGGLVGMFFALPGLILGPLIGGFVFEMAFAKMSLHGATKSTWGTIVGTVAGIAMRLAVSVVMVAIFIFDVLRG
jgi:uncharacterized protein